MLKITIFVDSPLQGVGSYQCYFFTTFQGQGSLPYSNAILSLDDNSIQCSTPEVQDTFSPTTYYVRVHHNNVALTSNTSSLSYQQCENQV